jgi:polyferredoxin
MQRTCLIRIGCRTQSRPERLRLSAVLGLVYVIGLIVASLTMPMYGGSLYWTDTEPIPARLSDENLIVFLVTGAVFLVLMIVLYGAKEK